MWWVDFHILCGMITKIKITSTFITSCSYLCFCMCVCLLCMCVVRMLFKPNKNIYFWVSRRKGKTHTWTESHPLSLQVLFWIPVKVSIKILRRVGKPAISFLLLFSHSFMSDCLRSHGLYHARLPCPSLSSRVC